MKLDKRLRYAFGAAVLLATAVFLLAIFALLSRTDIPETFLSDNVEERYGWRYEVLVDGEMREYEPVFKEDGVTFTFPEGTQAVRMRREMTEDDPDMALDWLANFGKGVEALLDGMPLHCDFPQVPRGADGFLRPGEDDWVRAGREWGGEVRHVIVALPKGYTGRELTMTTYFPPGSKNDARPIYPTLEGEEAFTASRVVYSVKIDAVMTVYALIALLIAGIYLLDIANDGADGKTLLLCLYFLMLFLSEINLSFAGYYSVLWSRLDTRLMRGLEAIPLYLYLALRLKKRVWKYPLCGAIAVLTVCNLVRNVLTVIGGTINVATADGPWQMVLFLLVFAAYVADAVSHNRQAEDGRKRMTFYAAASAAIAGAYLFGRINAWGGLGEYLTDGLLTAISYGNFDPVVNLLTDIAAWIALLAVVTEFVRRTLLTQKEVSALEERERLTLESYNRLMAAEESTSALRHEMRHHMIALSGILADGDAPRAARYLASVEGELDKLPPGRYSRNMLVSVIAGSYLDRARAEGIRVTHSLNVPPELAVADEDLSVLLSNMLQNALEACEKMRPESRRYIEIEMRLRENFLFIKCLNSAPEDETEARPRPGHGYGMAAMRRVAEKYDSVLLVERAPGEFEVKSCLCLERR